MIRNLLTGMLFITRHMNLVNMTLIRLILRSGNTVDGNLTRITVISLMTIEAVTPLNVIWSILWKLIIIKLSLP